MTPRKKEDEWVELKEAAIIVSQNSGREISPDYVKLMARKGRIQLKAKDGRQNYYLKRDVEQIVVKQRKKQNGAVPHEIEQQGGGEEKAA